MAYGKATLIGAAAVVLIGGSAYLARDPLLRMEGVNPMSPARAAANPAPESSVELVESLVASTKIEAVEERDFPVEKEAIGSIDFNGEMTLPVFTPYQGRIIDLFAKAGDDVNKGQTLYTLESPDLVQASSTLISSAGVLELTNRNLARLRDLVKIRAAAQKDLEQAISDQLLREDRRRDGSLGC
jgi:cobalt-zinc-cadmium efflux system membrane fusion protein